MGRVSIRLDLTGDEADKFLELKAKRGLKNNSELVRQLIAQAAQQELRRT